MEYLSSGRVVEILIERKLMGDFFESRKATGTVSALPADVSAEHEKPVGPLSA
jgi:hypothetical protein